MLMWVKRPAAINAVADPELRVRLCFLYSCFSALSYSSSPSLQIPDLNSYS